MNRIFKYSSLSAFALIALSGCTDDLLYLSPDSLNNGDSKVPFGTIAFRTGGQSRGSILTNDNLSAVEATAYTNIEKNEFKFEKYRFDVQRGEDLVCATNPQWPGVHRYRKPNDDGSYPDGTRENQKIPEKYKDWKLYPFDEAADANYADFHEPKPGKVVNEEDVPTGYVYLEDDEDRDWIYIVDYDEPSTLNLFVYSPPLEQLREAFNSGTQGKPGSTGLLLTPPVEVYDFYNTYKDGVGLTPPTNYNAHTELKIYYEDGVAKPGYKLGMFHVAQDISREVDFVTANMTPKARKINKDTEKNEEGKDVYYLDPVPATLEHQLCNIEIKAKNGNPNYDIDVAGVMIGRPMVYGPMFNFTTNEWEFPPLTRQDLYNPVTYAYSPPDAKHPVGDYIHRLGPDAVSLMGNGGNALVLPTKLEAWDYKDPDNADAYNFNKGDKPIMFFAALIRVKPKNADASAETLKISEMMYPFGYPAKDDWDYEGEAKQYDEYDWGYHGDYEGGTWEYIGNAWGDYGDGCWYPYGSEFKEAGDVWATDQYTGWTCDEETGLWSYDENSDKGVHKEEYSWLLNWRIEDGFWYYIGKETGAEWEMRTNEDRTYWKYKGDYKFDPETGEWAPSEQVIFPTKYVCDNSNFEYQEFCVDKNGKVLALSYNDRDKSEFTDDEKKEIKSKYKDIDIVFEKYAWVGFPVAVDWKKGHKYVYTLDFTPGLGVEIPNGIYGGRLISDIIKLFKEQEANEKNGDKSSKTSKSKRKKKSVKLPSGVGTVKMESSGKWTGPVIVK